MGTLALSTSWAQARVADEVKPVECRADLIHVDVMHAPIVHPLAIRPPVAAGLRRRTDRRSNAPHRVAPPEVGLGAV